MLAPNDVQRPKADTLMHHMQGTGRAWLTLQSCRPHGQTRSSPVRLHKKGRSSWWDICRYTHSDISSKISRCLKKLQRKWKIKRNYSSFYVKNFPAQINFEWTSWQSANQSSYLLLSRPWAEIRHSQGANEKAVLFHRLSVAQSYERFCW